MARIFISYARIDQPNAERLALALREAGHEVWWDKELKPAEDYDKQILKRVEAAEAVVVLWSPQAVESDWVRFEAQKAFESKKLVPVCFNEKTPAPPPPMSFMHVANLHAWSGARQATEFYELESTILKVIQKRWAELLGGVGGEAFKRTIGRNEIFREVSSLIVNVAGIPLHRFIGGVVLCAVVITAGTFMLNSLTSQADLTYSSIFFNGILFVGVARILAQLVSRPGKERELHFFDKSFSYWIVVFVILALANFFLMMIIFREDESDVLVHDTVWIATAGPAMFYFIRAMITAYKYLMRRV